MAEFQEQFCHETGGKIQNVRCLPATSEKNSTKQAGYQSMVTVEKTRIENEGTVSIILRLYKELVLF